MFAVPGVILIGNEVKLIVVRLQKNIKINIVLSNLHCL